MNRLNNDRLTELSEGLEALRDDIRVTQRGGFPFIAGSVIIWTLIAVVTSLGLPQLTENMAVLCCACPLLPLAYGVGKIFKVDIFDRSNPLWKIGIISTCNQIIYLLIVMWVYAAVPGKMLMVYAMIFGAHFLPYSWLYKSKVYLVTAIVIPIAALAMGLYIPRNIMAAVIACYEIVFALILYKTTKE
ncbi:MAG: hypothetical protein J5626_03175 [Lachnospiraceae bacterium]|nr:hypothetical protein [Lachnospiraceae bacterium]